MRGSMQATTTLLAGLLWHSTASGPGAVADTPQPTDVCTGSAGLRDDRLTRWHLAGHVPGLQRHYHRIKVSPLCPCLGNAWKLPCMGRADLRGCCH